MNHKFPDHIPIFPLSGVIYFPKTNLPLNIFEQRYLDLVNDAIQKDKLMGMVQSKRKNEEVYNIGCLGRISDYQKSNDGRILINLTGLTRFEVLEEKKNSKFNLIKFANSISKNSRTQVIIVKNLEELKNYLRKNLIHDEIVIGMGAGTISKWMVELKNTL